MQTALLLQHMREGCKYNWLQAVLVHSFCLELLPLHI